MLGVFSLLSKNSLAAAMCPEKVLIVVSSHDRLGNSGKKTGYYLAELSHPLFVLLDAGYKVDIASPMGGNAPIDPRSMKLNDSENKRLFNSPTLVWQIHHTIPLKAVKASDYAAVLFSGGHGPMWDFTNNPAVENLARAIYERGGIVAAVCHGPAALVNIKLSNNHYLIENKHLTAFSNAEEKTVGLSNVVPYALESALTMHGALYKAAAPGQKNVIVDGRLITGQNPASATGVGEAIVNALQANKN